MEIYLNPPTVNKKDYLSDFGFKLIEPELPSCSDLLLVCLVKSEIAVIYDIYELKKVLPIPEVKDWYFLERKEVQKYVNRKIP